MPHRCAIGLLLATIATMAALERSSGSRSRSSPFFRALYWVGVVVACAGALWFVWDNGLLQHWKRGDDSFAFFLATALLPLVGIPTTPFFVLAGGNFSMATAVLGSLAAISVNLVLSFWIARSRLRPRLRSLLERTRYTLPDLERAPERALRFAIMVKLTPGVPPSLKHYAIALAGVRFPIYFLVSFVVSSVYAAVFVTLGESLLQHDVRKAAAAGALLFVLLLAVTAWRRRTRVDVNRNDGARRLHA